MDLSNLSILYVEDEARSRKVMRMIAADMGVMHLTIFEDGTNFAQRAAALDPQPNLIFLDIHVPPPNGFEMLALLRENSQFDAVPIVAMTASVMNEEIDQLRSAGFDGCLAKPIDIDTFSQSVQQIIAGEQVWRIVN
jgi:two-component system, cell cycle response regulator DivK